MSLLRKVLIAGTGPAAVQLAVLLKRLRSSNVGIAGRKSVRSDPFFDALRQSGGAVSVDAGHSRLEKLKGECFVDAVFHEYRNIDEQWDTLILSVTADAYLPVLAQLRTELLQNLRCVALISPTFGSNALIRNYLREQGCNAEVISFSTYLGDTRRMEGREPNHVLTTAKKRKVYAGAAGISSESVKTFRQLYGEAGITLEAMDTALEAETRNISLYVHPPLFMNAFSLGVIFGRPAVPKFVYKLFPEGPITPVLIREMLELWKEVSSLVEKLNVKAVNLLQFMVDDNYPVRPESLARQDIDAFPELHPSHQQYCLYVRYASLLIDPYSEPDRNGRYFDFSAVPLRPIFLNHEGAWEIPRMPKEDYYRIKIIQGIACSSRVSCPTIDTFLARYERYLLDAAGSLTGSPLTEAFTPQSFEGDIGRICTELQLSNAFEA
ncbi:hypothetical protein FHS16_005374 [Paenibacillus endophyticus]|uniref:DUF2338 family protein n=1 Tax=Paenibacillus endophyticus TaxID=1294268 RepID=A0A7W5CCM3_9BACL|nr:opine metallophore biosynthesis dehydrogenase [Paenibacillus endophyticus]MBB3155266.1 hypothetical protein [Paenibacillus endophyticus]